MIAISCKMEVAVKHRYTYGALATLLALLSGLRAQNPTKPAPTGVVHDWTEHQIVFNRAALLKNPGLIEREPRIANREIERWKNAHPWVFGNESSTSTVRRRPHRDWNMDFALGRIAANMYPSKFSLDPGSAPDCANDFVIYGLNRAGVTGGQANLVALNNLYSGTAPPGICGTNPTVLFAYNVSTTVPAGRISTSPVLSLDGKKIAFVETVSGASVFHVLTWTAGAGTITNAADGSLVMTSLPFALALDTRSSIWVDYNTDIAYVGANDGVLYKITGVFNGTPTLAGSPWPVTLSSGTALSTPVLDKNLGLVLVGNQAGTFYSVDSTTGDVKAIVVGVSGGTNPGILAPPIVDVTNGTSFVVSANDGTSGVLVEVDSATMTTLAKGRLGIASHSGTAVSLFQPAFSDAYFDDPSTGVARLCGTGDIADISPWQYSFGFTGSVMNATPVFSQQLLTSTTARCTGWTEFFNPNTLPDATDFFFFGLTADCTGTGTSGCVMARTGNDLVAPVRFDVPGGPSGIVVDNDSVEDQASSLYFMGRTGPPNAAYKLTQSGLQ
jgi:hypothetical protein